VTPRKRRARASRAPQKFNSKSRWRRTRSSARDTGAIRSRCDARFENDRGSPCWNSYSCEVTVGRRDQVETRVWCSPYY
jgi:hypothetical protein